MKRLVAALCAGFFALSLLGCSSETPPPKPDPTKPDPTKTEPAKVDPAKAEPAKADPAKAPVKKDVE